MMKWNSSKTYTDDDMMRMQQDAFNRVRDFQSRAQDAASFYDVPVSSISDISDEPAVEAAGAESGQEPELVDPEVIEADSRMITPVQNMHSQQSLTDPIHKILTDLNLDSETLLIIGLMFLLYNEQADGVLLLALGYLLL